MPRASFRPSCRATLAGLAVALLPAVLLAAPPGAKTVWVRPDPTVATTPEVLEQGVPREVLSYQRTGDAPWHLVVYVDFPLSAPDTLTDALSALSAAADRLVELGHVEVLAADTVVQQVLEPSRDPAEVRAALDHVLGQRDRAGGLGELQHPDIKDAPEQDVLEAFFLEEELLEWQDALLVDTLWSERAEAPQTVGPRAVFLLRDLVVEVPAERARTLVGKKASVRFEPRLESSALTRQESIQRGLAATGWTLFPWLKEDAPPLEQLAVASGGSTLRDSSSLSSALNTLQTVYELQYRAGTQSVGEPYPLDLRAGPGTRIRASRWATTGPPLALARSRARRFSQGEGSGELLVASSYLLPESGSSLLETLVEWPEGQAPPADSSSLRLTVIRRELDRDPTTDTQLGRGHTLTESWLYRQPVEAPEEGELTVVVEDLASGTWGAASVEPATESLAARVQQATLEESGTPPPVDPGAPRRSTVPDPETSDQPTVAQLIGEPRQKVRRSVQLSLLKIVPPRGRRLSGTHEFKTLLTNMAIRKVVFEVDGTVVETDERKPFDARIDLGDGQMEHTVTAIAYSGQGLELSRDHVVVNRARVRRGLFLTDVSLLRGDDVRASADLVQGDQGPALDRVELYRNETLAATFTRPPFTAVLPGPGRADADYVRAVAYLRDGTFLEDVRLLGSDSVSERVDVNLVEVYAMVSDSEGNPVKGLSAEDFEVTRKGSPVTIDRFAIADEAALEVGLVVDTSLSMYSLMPDTRKAAAAFLSDILTPIDRAFLIDFDDRPRLAHPTTGRLTALLESLGSLRAGGSTALYDSILFAILHFEQGLGRKALVLLSDGDDYKSQFSYRRIYQTAQASGLPVYFIALGGFDEERPSFRKSDLEAIAKSSGGRVFYPSSMDQVNQAYRTIGDELRSQYVLAFSTEELLDDESLEEIKVKLASRKYKIRFVAGTQ